MNHDKNHSPSPEAPQSNDLLDPLVEAEGLRVALAEVARRVGRLVASLRHLQRQRRALHTAWSSLKQLGLGHQEKP